MARSSASTTFALTFGGKTILPSRAVAKIDLRLVPDQTAADCIAKLKAHLAKRGFGDIEVKVTGGYDPTQTEETSGLIQSELAVYRRRGLTPLMNPRLAGSWPGYIFTGAPVPAGADAVVMQERCEHATVKTAVFYNLRTTYGGTDITVPLGGVRQSGNGHDKSMHALDKYLDLKTAWIQL